jgi:hypothetical protein
MRRQPHKQAAAAHDDESLHLAARLSDCGGWALQQQQQQLPACLRRLAQRGVLPGTDDVLQIGMPLCDRCSILVTLRRLQILQEDFSALWPVCATVTILVGAPAPDCKLSTQLGCS